MTDTQCVGPLYDESTWFKGSGTYVNMYERHFLNIQQALQQDTAEVRFI